MCLSIFIIGPHSVGCTLHTNVTDYRVLYHGHERGCYVLIHWLVERIGVFLAVQLILLKHEGRPFHQFGFPTGKCLWIKLMLSAYFGCTLASTEYIEDHLCLKLGCKSSLLWHTVPLSWS